MNKESALKNFAISPKLLLPYRIMLSKDGTFVIDIIDDSPILKQMILSSKMNINLGSYLDTLCGPKSIPNNIIRMRLAKRLGKEIKRKMINALIKDINDGTKTLSDDELSKYKKLTDAIFNPVSIYYNINSIDKKYKDIKYIKFFKRELNREMLYIKRKKSGRKM